MTKKAKVVKPATKILLSFIQDRSGSMSSVWNETLSGFKSYVEDMQADQKKDNEVSYIFSLTTFDTQIDTPYLGVPIAKVDSGKLKDFGPRGMTALYDGIGKTLQALDDDKSITFDKAIVIICTDGCENSSREYSKAAVHAAIDERIKRGNWTFTYLGTQPETWDDASSLGMGVGASANYNAQNAGATYTVMAQATRSMARGVHAQSKSFLHDNTTPMMRCAVGMSTATDSVTGGLSGSGGLGTARIPLVVKHRTPPAPPVRHVPRPVAPVSGRKWK